MGSGLLVAAIDAAPDGYAFAHGVILGLSVAFLVVVAFGAAALVRRIMGA